MFDKLDTQLKLMYNKKLINNKINIHKKLIFNNN